MATRVNPFHTGTDCGKRRTLVQIEADTTGTRASFQAIQNQPAQPIHEREKVAQWLSHGLNFGQSNFIQSSFGQSSFGQNNFGQDNVVDLTGPSIFQPRRYDSFFAQVGGNTPVSWRPSLQPHKSATYDSPTRSATQTYLPSRQLKRNAAALDDSSRQFKHKAIVLDNRDEDIKEIIFVKTQTRTPRSSVKVREVIDLTGSDRPRAPKRTRSFLGHQDEDVIIIDPPAAEIRGQLRPLLLGTSGDSDARPEKRQKHTHTRLAFARVLHERPARRTVRVEVVVPEANTVGVAPPVQSVVLVCHFFRLPTEIRDKIYRYLLVSPKPIHVQHLWTELARRPTRRGRRTSEEVDFTIDTRILSACRGTALEGTRVLYSENTFLYMLRDASEVEKATARRSQRTARGRQNQDQRTINLAKYGHLLRHMAIELEPNRIGTDYEKLMGTALETLAPGSARTGAPSRCPPCGPIRLHTLTLTISPQWQQSQRTTRAAPAAAGNNQDTTTPEPRFLTIVPFFSRGGQVLKALQHLNTNFLRIHVHVNSDRRRGTDPSPPSSSSSSFSSDSDSDSDSVTNPHFPNPKTPTSPPRNNDRPAQPPRFLDPSARPAASFWRTTPSWKPSASGRLHTPKIHWRI
ncbi:hypothetical protein N0V88_002326 [Collariella sp. IMI 366227]|nr:hypothetical protein N0V88_002326 [Collariella sp. IMI 366227]